MPSITIPIPAGLTLTKKRLLFIKRKLISNCTCTLDITKNEFGVDMLHLYRVTKIEEKLINFVNGLLAGMSYSEQECEYCDNYYKQSKLNNNYKHDLTKLTKVEEVRAIGGQYKTIYSCNICGELCATIENNRKE